SVKPCVKVCPMKKVFGLVTLCVASIALGKPEVKDEKKVPDSLRPWVDWVKKGHEQADCPYLGSSDDADDNDSDTPTPSCLWPGRLELRMDAHGASFIQHFKVYRTAWVPLPGDEEVWPENVREGSHALAVLARDGVPHVLLHPGDHQLTGTFSWSES